MILSNRKLTALTVLSAVLMVITLILIFVYAPEEKTMGLIQKVFYFHVPMAWLSLLAFLVVFVGSIAYLAKNSVTWDIVARSSAGIGFIFNTLMLITGVIWARPVWGVWWTWDPRLTTSLVLWFIYIGYLLVRNFGFEREQSAKFAAVIGIIGFADVPVVALSTVLWRTQHPSALVFEGGLTTPMLITLITSLITFTLFYILLLNLSISLRRMEEIIAEAEASSDFEEEEEGLK